MIKVNQQASFRARPSPTALSAQELLMQQQKEGQSPQISRRRRLIKPLPSMLSHKALLVPSPDEDAHETALASDIAECISNELKTLALIAALLSSWAVTVYAGEQPMDEGLCFGPPMVKASYVIFWISLGWFFLCISSILAIIADLDGVPRQFLFTHLKQGWVRVIYQVPEISMIGGIVFLAVGYALDVGERAGCAFFYFGFLASTAFVGSVALLFVMLKRARRQLCGYDNKREAHGYLGKSFIATWRDRMDKHTRHVSESESERSSEVSFQGHVAVMSAASYNETDNMESNSVESNDDARKIRYGGQA